MKEIHYYLAYAVGSAAGDVIGIRMNCTPLVVLYSISLGLSLGFAMAMWRFGRSL
jgi:hypothetical protein